MDELDPPVNCRVILNTVNKKKKMKKMKKAVMQWQWTKKENNDNI